MKRRVALFVVLAFIGAGSLQAQSTLFYLELQAVASYSSAGRAIQLYSLMAGDVMQKPSLGFDLVKRISGRSRDYGVLAFQARLAYNQEGAHPFEVQLYNASFRYKAGFADVWAGHSRPALGLDYALDSHSLLLPAPAMMGFGFERDWGLGLQRDFSWGNGAVSLTAGSGMPLYFKGNYLAAVRFSGGVLARDNYSLGLSLAGGRILETMGNHLLDPEPTGFAAVAADATYLFRNLENRFEVMAGRNAGASVLLLFWRTGVGLMEEGRLRIEGQPAVMKTSESWNWQLAGGLSYQITGDIAARSMILRDSARQDTRFVLQLYFYKSL
jgi:hypothetical protein